MRPLERHTLTAAIAALALLLAACAGGPPATSAESGTDSDAEPGADGGGFPARELEPGQEVDRSRPMTAHVRVEASGAATFVWEGVEEIQITRIGGPGLNVNLLSVGFLLPLRTAEGSPEWFRWAFDLLHAYGDEPSVHVIDDRPVNERGLRHEAFLIFFRANDADLDFVANMEQVDYYTKFDQLRQPCEITVGADEASGSLVCPELADEAGDTVRLSVEWSPPPGR